jgi:GntR family transcriptional regulator
VERLDLQLSDASGVPRYRQIVDQVALLVRSRQLVAGARLPSVRELAGQLLVSLITIRRAYADLEAAGLIVRRQGQGTFVAELDDAASRRDARDDARELLADAVSRARQLGLNDDGIRDHVDRMLGGTGGNDDER